MSREIDLCEELAAAVNNATYPLTFNATADYVVDPDLENLRATVPLVSFTPLSMTGADNGDGPEYRGDAFGDFWIIGLVVNAGGFSATGNKDQIKVLIETVRQIHATIAKEDKNGEGYSMVWTGARTMDPIFNREELKVKNRFLSITQFTFFDQYDY